MPLVKQRYTTPLLHSLTRADFSMLNTASPVIYLASASPRRGELLAQIGMDFRWLVPHADEPEVDESVQRNELADAYVMRLARAKAAAGEARRQLRHLPSGLIIAADTTVVVDTTILGKPRDHADAARMLRLLSGREHRVLTAVAVQRAAHMEVALSDSCVRFCTLNDDQINQYIVSGEANDKAGAYGIQGRAAQFIQHLSGSYSGVMGLPLFETTQLIQHVCADRATKEAVHE